ncbi:MAG TPA: thioredoxin family protein, partial [Candidatus Dormibacteraeota bacterium]|nr:thioredoxin family protein [Candidatus Dormibacteraeota bacterium]
VQPQTEKLSSEPGVIRLRATVKKLQGDWPTEVSGLLVEQTDNRQAFEARLPIASNGPTLALPGSATGASSPPRTRSLWTMLLYAFLGGLILNVMPCVLPVIALKILGFVGEARNEPGRVRKLGLIYTAGVLSSFLVLALVVVLLGAGWGFQFGNPYFLIAMTTLVTLIALNLFGVFEVTLSSGALTAASQLASKQGAAGAFFNGLLTTVLATSCSAPFLAAAVGFASALKNPLVAMLVMLTVGIGLAAPYLILSWQPSWLRFLPKPGAWMERFKVAMGFPMAAAAIWLCSLVRVFYADRAWWLAMFLVFVAVAAWIFGEFIQRGTKRRGLAALACLIILAAGYAYPLEKQMDWRKPLDDSAAAASSTPRVAPRGGDWQSWSPGAIAAAQAAGRPVVVDFTATWCPTCNTIVKPSFESDSVQKKLKEVNAVTLVADFSTRPKAIAEELKRFDRAGSVPLVLVYPAKPDAPPELFDIVTPGTIVNALDSAVR